MTLARATAAESTPLRGGWARCVLRLAAIPLVTGACWVAWRVVGIGQGGERRREVMVRRWARAMTRLLHITVEQVGRVPERPFLLVANHLGYLDVIVFLSLLDATFIAKRQVLGWPMLGPLARVVGTIFIDRDSLRDTVRVAAEMAFALEHGRGIVLFAEGTSSDGSRVLPVRPALLEGAARSGYPVHVASLSYHTSADAPPAGEVLCWWGTMTFLPHLAGVCRLPHALARVAFDQRPVQAHDRRLLASRLHDELTRSFIPSGHAS